MSKIASTAGLLAAGLLAAAAGHAQTPASAAPAAAAAKPGAPAAPAAAPSPVPQVAPAAAGAAAGAAQWKGPLIAGVCLFSENALIERSKAGQAVTARLRELQSQVQTSVSAERARLDARAKALAEKRATLSPLEMQTQETALNKRAQAWQAEAAERQQQLEAAKARGYRAVVAAAQSYVSLAYAGHNCGLMFARETVLGGNLGNDLTDEVVTAYDENAKPIAVELEPLHGAR